MEGQPAVKISGGELREYRLSLSGMTCGACKKVIEKVAVQNGAEVKEIDASQGFAVISCTEERITGVIEQLALKGFKAKEGEGSGDRGNPGRVLTFIRSVVAGESHVEVESRLMNYAIGTIAFLVMAAIPLFAAMPAAYGNQALAAPLFGFVILSSVLSVYAVSHMDSYRKGMTCPNGMMIGMTTGMVSGYMVGAVLGVTNGMFVGSVTGTGVGIFIGLAMGRYGGVMGGMEGVMAGLMSGTMGAMTSVMMINDNLLAFLFILGAVCSVTTVMLSYMMFREAGPAPAAGLRLDFARFALMSAAFCAGLLAIIAYGPKGPTAIW